MVDLEPSLEMKEALQRAPQKAISNPRMALLFSVMLVTAAGNTAMQSVMPSIGTT
ncbi:MAG: hypothetical protein SXU28_14380 [Pseudomonadota bacterium]|nr:hypothetical protein [Pseudomonadota bacterium]